MKDLFDEAITDELLDRFERFMERWTRILGIVAVVAAVLWILVPGICIIVGG